MPTISERLSQWLKNRGRFPKKSEVESDEMKKKRVLLGSHVAREAAQKEQSRIDKSPR